MSITSTTPVDTNTPTTPTTPTKRPREEGGEQPEVQQEQQEEQGTKKIKVEPIIPTAPTTPTTPTKRPREDEEPSEEEEKKAKETKRLKCEAAKKEFNDLVEETREATGEKRGKHIMAAMHALLGMTRSMDTDDIAELVERAPRDMKRRIGDQLIQQAIATWSDWMNYGKYEAYDFAGAYDLFGADPKAHIEEADHFPAMPEETKKLVLLLRIDAPLISSEAIKTMKEAFEKDPAIEYPESLMVCFLSLANPEVFEAIPMDVVSEAHRKGMNKDYPFQMEA
jgi:hypothetical protein